MAKLTREVQAYIVRSLAEFQRPMDVVRAVKEEYGLDVSRQQVRLYNPEQCKPAQEWVELFWAHREGFRKGSEAVGIASAGFRLKELDALYREMRDLARKSVEKKYLKLAGEQLKLAGELLDMAHRWCGPADPAPGSGGDASATLREDATPEEAARYLEDKISTQRLRAPRPAAPFQSRR